MHLPRSLEFLRRTEPWRKVSELRYLQRMKPRTEFYRHLVSKGQLVFDVGANAGNYTLLLHKIGARVVAVEPQADLASGLKARFSHTSRVSVVRAALGGKISKGILRKTPDLNEVASMHPDISQRSRFSLCHPFSSEEEVPVLTLDTLIAEHGTPSFCKIDVEGYELEVLKGLGTALKLISIEFNREFWSETCACLELLARKASYRFNYTLGEAPVFRSQTWLSSGEVMAELASLEDPLLWGDIYARL